MFDSTETTSTLEKENILQDKSGFNYFMFGLHLHSNLPLPGVIPEKPSADRPKINLYLGMSPNPPEAFLADHQELTYESSDTNEKGDPVLRIWKVALGTFVRLAYEDGTEFWIDRERENVWATWPDQLSLENTTSYLLGPVLGVVLRIRGVTCLHSSAVAIGDRCVALVGSAGRGKSTTAAAFAKREYAVISDDIVAIVEREGDFLVMPAYPHLCLWPESVSMLYDSPEALPRLIPDWDKRRMNLGEHGTRFETRSLPLAAIYVLGERRPDPAPYLESMRPRSALLALVADTYANKILDREMRAHEFAVLGRLVTTVPIRRIYPHEDPTRLGELCKVIREDLDSLGILKSNPI